VNKKYGPLPLWAWGLVGGVAIYFLYRYYSNSAATASSSSPTSQVLDPNAIDPNTGLTYGQEESAALNAGAAAGVPGSGGGSTGSIDTTSQGIDSFDQGLQAFLQAYSDLQAVNGALNGAQANAANANYSSGSDTTGSSAPVTPSSPPTVTPAVNPPQTAHMEALKIGREAQSILSGARSLIGQAGGARNAPVAHQLATKAARELTAAKTAAPTQARQLAAQARANAARARADAARAVHRATQKKKKKR
jgi:hypothetical protein